MTTTYVIGVDGGGTKTTALLAGEGGQILGRGEAGPSNYHAVGAVAALGALEEAVRAAWAAAGLAPQPLAAICLGMAGVDRTPDRKLVQDWSAAFFPGVDVELINDARLVLAAGTPDEYGLAIISGTGSIVYGSDRQGRMARAGGWGYLLGDEGSGYCIGVQALRAVTRAHDRRAPQTALTRAILGAWSLKDPTELVTHVYSSQVLRRDIAALAVLVDQAATDGDAVALEILTEAGHELAIGARAVAGQLGLSGPLPCALAGGTVVKGRHVAGALRRSAEAMGLVLEPVQTVSEPVVGAVRIALRKVGGLPGD